MIKPNAEDKLSFWLRYEFLPRQSDGSIWKDKPAAETALHFLQVQQEELERLKAFDPDGY